MSKIKNMATEVQKKELSDDLLKLKSDLGLTYSKLASKLNKPCTPATLRNIAKHPGKGCSLKLNEKIKIGIIDLKKYKTKKLELEQIKKEYIDELIESTNKYHKKIEDFYKKK